MVKKALIIGINYIGTDSLLGGCINDAWNVCSFLTHHYDYEPQNITLLSDDPDHVGSGLPSWAPPIPDPESLRKKKKKDKKSKKKKNKKKKKHQEEDEDEEYGEEGEYECEGCEGGEYDDDGGDEEGEYEEDDEGEYEEDEEGEYEEDEGGEYDDEDYEYDEDDFEDEYEGYGRKIGHYAYQYTAACRGIKELSRGGKIKRDVATKRRILQGIKWLVSGAQEGDSLFFHFSGHGCQEEDKDGDEDDGFDEAICPQDYETAGIILDDDLHEQLIETLPEGVNLQIILDCCHSGSGADLPFVFRAIGQRGSSFGRKSSKKKSKKEAMIEAGGGKESEANVVMFSGCMDDETSADVEMDGSGTGAVSFAFITALMENRFELSYADLLYTMKEILAENFGSKVQCPLLSTNIPDFDFTQRFDC